ncbi:MAG: hypothetical protein ACRDTG_30480 [Pseudonocardiaceae bacterium]
MNDPEKHATSAGQGRYSDHRISIPEWIGIFVGVFTLLLTFVNSDLQAKITIIIIGVAAALVLALATHLVTDQRRSRRQTVRIMVGTAMFVALIAVAVVISPHNQSGATASGPSPATTSSASDSPLTSSSDYPPSPTAAREDAPQPFITKQGYVLRPSSSIATNDQDKVDMDTGCPGWGDMRPRLGPSRCGEQADIIADEEGIHTADGGPHLYTLATDARTFESCVAALNTEPDSGMNQLDVASLKVDDQICVRTDKRNIALIQIDAMTTDTLGQLAKLTIKFEVWQP